MKRLLPLALLAAGLLPAADPPPGKTWALLIGISQYSKLPRDLWLQYADADARAFQAFLTGPQGGSVPTDRILLLANEQATASAVRSAFASFLNKPGKEDTVYVFVAGHGTVDDTGAYILTSDSDPLDLRKTALNMAEFRSLVEGELNRAARVVFLADVCRAAAIAGQKSSAVGAVVEKLGEAPGEMLGLMAARPRELSNEGPEYGGGHGAFTWSVLQGLAGAADSDHSGFVTASELIDYVTTDVPKRTGGRQHPRDFGNIENSTRLSLVK